MSRDAVLQKCASNLKRKAEVIEENTSASCVKAKVRNSQQRTHSEEMAKQLVESGEIHAETVLKVLLATDIPMNSTRKNVLPEGVDAVRGMLLGFYALASNVGITDASRSNPWLVRLLSSFARKSHPEFEFTSIQVNKNYASRPHVDRNNLGDSLIVALGDYSGGDIWVHDEAGNVPFELQESISSMYHYESNVTYIGSLLDLKRTWRYFNGNKLHYTKPFEGDRFSLVYYTCSRYSEASLEMCCELQDAGFPFSKSSQRLSQALLGKQKERQECNEKWKQLVKDRIREAKEELGKCSARTWNRGWGGRCPHYRSEDGEFCKMHAGEAWRTHGTVEGPVPKAKRAEMLKCQKQMVAEGEKPPDPLPDGALILVDL